MRSITFYATLAAGILLMTGCGDKLTRITPPCYIIGYSAFDSFEVAYPDEYCETDTNFPFVMVQHKRSRDATAYLYRYPEEKGADDSWFLEKFSRKYGDTSYYEELEYIVAHPPGHSGYFTPDMRDISVVCSTDYDAAHPAGTDLGDIIRYSGGSLYPFIKNGYMKPEMSGIEASCQADSLVLDFIDGQCFFPIFKNIDELTEEDLYLNGQNLDRVRNELNFFCLTFMSLPDDRTRHDFTVTMNGADGNVYTAEFMYDFGKAGK